MVLATVAVGVALYLLRPVMIPFVLAVFFALALSPLVDVQMRYLRAPRLVAVVGTLAIGLVVLGLLATLMSTSLNQLAANASGYQRQLAQLMSRVVTALPLEELGWSEQEVLRPLSKVPVSAVGRMLMGTTNAILDTLSQSVLVLIFIVYLLIGGAGSRAEDTGTWGMLESRVKRYLVTQAVISAATGVLVWLVLELLGVDLAMVFGLFAFLLNFIPTVGSIIATLLPLPVVLFSPDMTALSAALAIAIPGSIQFTIGNIIAPKVMGDSFEIHPIAILLALILWGMIWGIVGMLLATPITAVMKILFERLDGTRPLANILAGRL
ncbi:MAG: AI-2E family transporter [Deltaproteobacteria bacterium]|nr:MAG: AI-2E family transporter [Deltaproteobacteria bacterium]